MINAGAKLIEVKDLKKNFGSLEVLKGINETIHKGEVVSIIGPSGSGKSTFLRCLNLLEKPTSGQVIFEGVDIADKKINIDHHRQKIAIKQNLIPTEITPAQASIIYAEEADVLNVAMFGITAKIWHEQNPELKGNIRDYASINELICLSNMENLNAVFIDQGIPQGERLIKLNQIAIQQMRILEDDGKRKLLK